MQDGSLYPYNLMQVTFAALPDPLNKHISFWFIATKRAKKEPMAKPDTN